MVRFLLSPLRAKVPFIPSMQFAFRLTGVLHTIHGGTGDPSVTQRICLPQSRNWDQKTDRELKLLRSCLQCRWRGRGAQSAAEPVLPPVLAAHPSWARSSASKADAVPHVQGEQVSGQQRSLQDAELISVPEKATRVFL